MSHGSGSRCEGQRVDDLRAQFEFLVQIRDRLSEVTDAVEGRRTER